MNIDNLGEVLRHKVRTLRDEDPVLYCLDDLAAELVLDMNDAQLQTDLAKVPAHMRPIRPLHGPNGVAEQQMLTADGLAALLTAPSSRFLRAIAFTLLSRGVTDLLGVAVSKARKKQSSTAWGEQPARGRVRAHGLSVAEFVRLVNGVPTLPKGEFPYPTMSSVLTGRQLPSPDLLRRMVYVLQAPPSQLLSPEALRSYERKYGAIPSPVSPTAPQPPSELASAPVADDDDLPPIDWDEEDRKAEAAMREAFGAAAFQTGFSAVTGSGPSSESSLPAPEDLDPSV